MACPKALGTEGLKMTVQLKQSRVVGRGDVGKVSRSKHV